MPDDKVNTQQSSTPTSMLAFNKTQRRHYRKKLETTSTFLKGNVNKLSEI